MMNPQSNLICGDGLRSSAKEENEEGLIASNLPLLAAEPPFTLLQQLDIILKARLYFYLLRERGKGSHKRSMRIKFYEGFWQIFVRKDKLKSKA